MRSRMMRINDIYKKHKKRNKLFFCIDVFSKIGGVILFLFLINLFLRKDFSLILIFVYLILAHYFVRDLVNNLWLYIGKPRSAQRLTATLGNVERLIYIFCFIMQEYSFIALFFGFKIAYRLVLPSVITKEKELRERGERTNSYIIGNIASLFFGLTAAFLFDKWLVLHNYYDKVIDLLTIS